MTSYAVCLYCNFATTRRTFAHHLKTKHRDIYETRRIGNTSKMEVGTDLRNIDEQEYNFIKEQAMKKVLNPEVVKDDQQQDKKKQFQFDPMQFNWQMLGNGGGVAPGMLPFGMQQQGPPPQPQPIAIPAPQRQKLRSKTTGGGKSPKNQTQPVIAKIVKQQKMNLFTDNTVSEKDDNEEGEDGDEDMEDTEPRQQKVKSKFQQRLPEQSNKAKLKVYLKEISKVQSEHAELLKSIIQQNEDLIQQGKSAEKERIQLLEQNRCLFSLVTSFMKPHQPLMGPPQFFQPPPPPLPQLHHTLSQMSHTMNHNNNNNHHTNENGNHHLPQFFKPT